MAGLDFFGWPVKPNSRIDFMAQWTSSGQKYACWIGVATNLGTSVQLDTDKMSITSPSCQDDMHNQCACRPNRWLKGEQKKNKVWLSAII